MPEISEINFVTIFQIAGLVALAGIATALAMNYFRQNKNLHADFETQQAQITEMFRILQYLKQTTDNLEQENRELRREMDLRGLYKGETDTHLQAIHAARAGASAEEIAQTHNLIIAEAELIVSMHGNQAQTPRH